MSLRSIMMRTTWVYSFFWGKLGGVMFKKIKRLFEKKTQAIVFSDAEVNAVKIAHSPVFTQISMAYDTPESPGTINNKKHITPWVIGYMNGTIDCAIQKTTGENSASFELLRFFLEYHFTVELHQELWACYISTTHLSDKPNDPFYPIYEDFLLGARVGFETLSSGTPSFDLFRELTTS